jgi:uncharacterized DUF497 family protein
VDIESGPANDTATFEQHQISLSRAVEIEILVFLEDDRSTYGEVRCRAWGLINGKAYGLAFTDRNGNLRAISLRRAHKKEIDRHAPHPRDGQRKPRLDKGGFGKGASGQRVARPYPVCLSKDTRPAEDGDQGRRFDPA